MSGVNKFDSKKNTLPKKYFKKNDGKIAPNLKLYRNIAILSN